MQTMFDLSRRRRVRAGVQGVCATLAAAVGLALLSGQPGARAQGTAGKRIALARGTGIPGEVVGQWRFTTISGVTHWDSSGRYLGSGSGGAQSYVFAKDGTYTMFNYVKSNSYGWTIQTLTWQEGTASFSGGTVTLRPTSGRYQVADNYNKKNNYRRPMRPDELKKNAKSVPWSVDQRDGKTVLLMGGATFERAK